MSENDARHVIVGTVVTLVAAIFAAYQAWERWVERLRAKDAAEAEARHEDEYEAEGEDEGEDEDTPVTATVSPESTAALVAAVSDRVTTQLKTVLAETGDFDREAEAAKAAEAADDLEEWANTVLNAYIATRRDTATMFNQLKGWSEHFRTMFAKFDEQLKRPDATAEPPAPRELVQLVNADTGNYAWVRPSAAFAGKCRLLDGRSVNDDHALPDVAQAAAAVYAAINLRDANDESEVAEEGLGEVLGAYEPCDRLYVIRYALGRQDAGA